MRAPRIRFTVRGLMVTVAIIGAALGISIEIGRLRRLSEVYRGRAVFFAEHEREARVILDLDLQLLAGSGAAAEEHLRRTGGRDEGLDAEASHHGKLVRVDRELCDRFAAFRRKYERAASRPWESVALDPPFHIARPGGGSDPLPAPLPWEPIGPDMESLYDYPPAP